MFGLVMIGSLGAQAQTTAGTGNKLQPVAVYITAHPDDWQLFMGADACADVQKARSKTVFICLTGGQANTPADNFWKAREAGCQASVHLATTMASPTTGPLPEPQTILINGHSITMVRYQGAVAYFLRLSDGAPDGKGQSRGKFQSMEMLFKEGRSMTPLDGGATYTTWPDLVQTVRSILKKEVCNNPVNLHIPQPNAQYNVKDHSDHRMAGRVALAATKQVECRTMMYTGYSIARQPINLSAEQVANQRAVYKAYSQTMGSMGQPDSWDSSHLQFIGRQYAQVLHRSGQLLDTQPDTVAQASRPGGDITNEPSAPQLPSSLVLEPNYPNPFMQSSLMAYQLPAASAVWLRVLDMQGREILRLANGEQQTAGRHEQWLDVNSFPAAGLYLAELRVGDQRRTCRMEIIR